MSSEYALVYPDALLAAASVWVLVFQIMIRSCLRSASDVDQFMLSQPLLKHALMDGQT